MNAKAQNKEEKKKQWRQREEEAVSVDEDAAAREEEEEEGVGHVAEREAAREAGLLRQGRETRWKMREYGAELRHQDTRC